jgi:hypothetical protein
MALIEPLKVNAALFIPLEHDVLCAFCGRFAPRQWDDREREQIVGWQFRWCIHELCWRCAGAVVKSCPVCAVSGPQGIDLSLLEQEALATPEPPLPFHEPLWPWFLIAACASAVLIAYGAGWLRMLGIG